MPVPTIEAVETAEATLEFIKEHDRLWNQTEWMFGPLPVIRRGLQLEEAVECGTACCFAGWYALVEGRKIVQPGPSRATYVEVEVGNLVDLIELRAYVDQRLGLPSFNWWAGNHPFDAGNTLPMLEQWVALLRESAENGEDVLDHPSLAEDRRLTEETIAEDAELTEEFARRGRDQEDIDV